MVQANANSEPGGEFFCAVEGGEPLIASESREDGVCRPVCSSKEKGRRRQRPGRACVSYDSVSSTSWLSSVSVTKDAHLERLSDEEAEEPLLSDAGDCLSPPYLLPAAAPNTAT